MTYADLLGAARIAEDLDLAVFARSDHIAFEGIPGPHATDAFASLAGLARDTARIGLAVLVSPITFRHPGLIAKNAATIDEMSGGRFALGVGTGWSEFEHAAFGLPFPDWPERFARLEEALGYLRAAFGKADAGYRGTHYSLSDDPVRPGATGPLPIIVGGTGPTRTPRLAGTYADEYNVSFLPPDQVAARVAVAREAAAAAGRNPDELLISVLAPAVTGSDDAAFRRNLAAIAAADPFGRDPDAIAARFAERGLPCGPAEEARSQLAALEEAGVGRFYLQHLGPFDRPLLEDLFGALRS
jgi:alkanesulfonate monooxygenase SsuD/methylene tetrahydromethanopterin reductase-like flavin-dependent oxidoreductase (luciferase family)